MGQKEDGGVGTNFNNTQKISQQRKRRQGVGGGGGGKKEENQQQQPNEIQAKKKKTNITHNEKNYIGTKRKTLLMECCKINQSSTSLHAHNLRPFAWQPSQGELSDAQQSTTGHYLELGTILWHGINSLIMLLKSQVKYFLIAKNLWRTCSFHVMLVITAT